MRAFSVGLLHGVLEALGRVSERRFLGAVVLAAFVVRAAWIAVFEPRPISDFAYYYEHAITLANGGGYSTGGVPTAFWPVGYPAFLGALFWLFGPSLLVVELANALLSALTLVFVYRYASLVTSSRVAARLATIAVAAFPSQVGYCALASDSVLFGVLLWSGASLIVAPSLRPGRAVVVGCIFGAATLVRPYAMLLPLVLTLGRRRQGSWAHWMTSTVLAFAALFALVLPWTLRNHHELGAPVLVSTNGGINLYIGNNPQASGGYADPPQLGASSGEVERDRVARSAALDYVFAHPLHVLSMVPLKLFHLYAEDSDSLRWTVKGERDVSSGYRFSELAGMALFSGYYYVVLLAALAYFVLSRRRAAVVVDRGPLWLIAYFSAIAAVFFGSPRFHFPIIPAISIYAAAFVCSLASNGSE